MERESKRPQTAAPRSRSRPLDQRPGLKAAVTSQGAEVDRREHVRTRETAQRDQAIEPGALASQAARTPHPQPDRVTGCQVQPRSSAPPEETISDDTVYELVPTTGHGFTSACRALAARAMPYSQGM